MNVSHKYGVVRALAFVLKLLAWLALLAGILAAVAAGVSSSGGPYLIQVLRTLGLITGPLLGVIWFVQLFAFGSILSLLVDIEENTRVLASEPSALGLPVE